mmetsp:Transcript_11120/g.22560  ORF Transcript_11120/g.22560 Transcript_11120/m.22560 type:complete len:264 (+) Transcript_11120:26-817(+)
MLHAICRKHHFHSEAGIQDRRLLPSRVEGCPLGRSVRCEGRPRCVGDQVRATCHAGRHKGPRHGFRGSEGGRILQAKNALALGLHPRRPQMSTYDAARPPEGQVVLERQDRVQGGAEPVHHLHAVHVGERVQDGRGLHGDPRHQLHGAKHGDGPVQPARRPLRQQGDVGRSGRRGGGPVAWHGAGGGSELPLREQVRAAAPQPRLPRGAPRRRLLRGQVAAVALPRLPRQRRALLHGGLAQGHVQRVAGSRRVGRDVCARRQV